MNNNDGVITLITHSNYIDICNNFVELLKKNWSDCPYRIVGVIMGDNVKIVGIDCIYVENASTLPECLLQVINVYPASWYMSFLGDAFIAKKVDQSLVSQVIGTIKKNDIQYCCLIPKKSVGKKIQISDLVRKIHYSDRYNHSFISFIATPSYIREQFSNHETDFDFEMKYLSIADGKEKRYFENECILLKNILWIYPGIDKSKWNRKVLRILKKNNPSVMFSERGKLSVKEQIIYDLRELLVNVCPRYIRILLKRLASKAKLFTFVSKT